VLDAETGEEIRRSQPFDAPSYQFLNDGDIAWDDRGIAAVFGNTLITFDNDLRETGRTTFTAHPRL
jgi:hypothetical protein